MKDKLVFKSVDACFEYMEKFFTNDELKPKSLYHGKILHMIVNDAGKKTLAYVKVLCLINGKTDYAMVSAFLCDCDIFNCECKPKYKKDDMVYIGMGTVINKTIDNRVRRWEKTFKTEEEYQNAFSSPFKHCIDIYFDSVPHDDYDVWAVAFEDDKGNEIHREDANPDEIKRMMTDPDRFCRLWRSFNTVTRPHKWIVWPHSKKEGWVNRMEGVLE